MWYRDLKELKAGYRSLDSGHRESAAGLSRELRVKTTRICWKVSKSEKGDENREEKGTQAHVGTVERQMPSLGTCQGV